MKNKLNCNMDNRREFVLQVAKEMFSINGFHNTSIRDIAGVVPMNTSMVSYYFQNKENLLVQILENIQKDILEIFAAIKLHADYKEKLKSFINRCIDYSCASANGVRLLFQTLVIDVSEPIVNKAREIVAMFKSFFVDLIDKGKIEGSFSTSESSNILYNFVLGTINNALQCLEIQELKNENDCKLVMKDVNLFVINGLSYYLGCDLT
ncbi:TetR/AcrR family transcriptional regulator [Sphingobacterium sp. UME9]|uniref:TetR/AcrR family transcriptional regulator n=1 Tax=Sphingobacterium sp. UME9 TaxID=1862316 RepID=UPI00160262F1|nr:TetR/AcrR family transcriptional regulator [Sphingobacterium sp. UME9]